MCILLAALTFATGRIYISDFNPLNGDFQNYNAFRRLLDGQVPYKDFANYLGVGIFITNIPLLFFMNNFTASLFITNFTTCFIFSVSVTTLFFVCTKNKTISCILGAISPFICDMISRNPALGELYEFSKLYTPGNSMRMHRAFLPFLLVIVFIIFKKLYFMRYGKEINIFLLVKSKKSIAFIGFVIGLFITWSNDFGFASFASSVIIMAILIGCSNKRVNLKYFIELIIFTLVAICGFFLSMLIVSGGNIVSFINFTLGVADYQFWYYGNKLGKMVFIADIFINKIYISYIILFIVITIIFIIEILKNSVNCFDILLYYIELTTFFAIIIYIYGSGRYEFEAFELTTFIICISYVINIASFILKKYKYKF